MKNNKGGIMAHSSICSLNPIMQTEILKVIDWQGEYKKAFKENPGRQHSEFVCGELCKRLMYLNTARNALFYCLNGNAFKRENNLTGDDLEKDVLELLDTSDPFDQKLRETFKKTFDFKRRYREEHPDNVNPDWNGFTGNTTIFWATTLLPFPLLSDESNPRVHYTKSSNRVYKFIESLGVPDENTVKEFMKDITGLEQHDECAIGYLYEQHLEIAGELDSGVEKIFIDFYVGKVHSVVFVRCKSFRNGNAAGYYAINTDSMLTDGKMRYSQELMGNPHGDKFEKFFNFMVNAWLAERTCLVNKTEEPMSVKNATINAIGFKNSPESNDMSARYRYIQVTDEAWKKYKESEAVFKQHCTDCNYTKAFWFRKSHFAQRNGNIYLVSAHWCHRTCAEVSPGPARPVVEVLV